MTQVVKLRRSSVPGREPAVSQLELGELAVNTTDGKVFLKKSVAGVESIITIVSEQDTNPNYALRMFHGN